MDSFNSALSILSLGKSQMMIIAIMSKVLKE